jgi:hypothetical protein
MHAKTIRRHEDSEGETAGYIHFFGRPGMPCHRLRLSNMVSLFSRSQFFASFFVYDIMLPTFVLGLLGRGSSRQSAIDFRELAIEHNFALEGGKSRTSPCTPLTQLPNRAT